MQHLAIVLAGLIGLGGIAPPAPAQAADRPMSTQSTPPKGVPADPRIPRKPAASTPAPAQRPPAPPALPAVRTPRSLAVFAADVYRAQRGIDGSLLLTDAQKAQIAGLTESIRDNAPGRVTSACAPATNAQSSTKQASGCASSDGMTSTTSPAD